MRHQFALTRIVLDSDSEQAEPHGYVLVHSFLVSEQRNDCENHGIQGGSVDISNDGVGELRIEDSLG